MTLQLTRRLDAIVSFAIIALTFATAGATVVLGA